MKFLNLFLLLLLFSADAFADIPLPKRSPQKTKSVDVRMNIRFSTQAKTPTLSIPKSALKDLRAQLDEIEESDAATADARTNLTRTQVIVSGLFLSLGIVFGGVWFARSRNSDSPFNKKIVTGLILFFIASSATVALANVGPPRVLRSISSGLFDKQAFTGSWRRASGDVRLEVTTAGDEIQFVIPDAEGKMSASEE